jgi:hypothetical protein
MRRVAPHAHRARAGILVECGVGQQPQKRTDAQNDESELEHDGGVLQLRTPD